MGAMVRANGDGLFPRVLSAVPVGGSPTGAGESPAPPIPKKPSQITSTSTSKSKKIPLEIGFHNSGKSRFYPISTGLVHEKSCKLIAAIESSRVRGLDLHRNRDERLVAEKSPVTPERTRWLDGKEKADGRAAMRTSKVKLMRDFAVGASTRLERDHCSRLASSFVLFVEPIGGAFEEQTGAFCAKGNADGASKLFPQLSELIRHWLNAKADFAV